MIRKLADAFADKLILWGLHLVEKHESPAAALEVLLNTQDALQTAGKDLSPRLQNEVLRRAAAKDGFEKIGTPRVHNFTETELAAAAERDGFA